MESCLIDRMVGFMEKAEQLQQINEAMHAVCACALKETATNVVPGVGNPDADILFIGEAPGKNEDLKGVPFVGAAGKFLDEMLGKAGLVRSDVYITNVVKYRPPNNRDPLPEEVEQCWPWLEAQIQLIDPKVIVTLGRHSLDRFVPNRRISADHGKAFRREIPGLGNRVYFALYHPAAALYNGGLRETLIKDFMKVPKVVELINQKK